MIFWKTNKGERVICLKNKDQANDGRDALAKALYERLFGWIVRHINDLLCPNYILKWVKMNLNSYIPIQIIKTHGR